jgi:hypothetical protein
MDWTMITTILGVNVAMIAFIAGFIFWIFNKLDADVNAVGDRLDGWMKHSIAIQAEQAKRTDKLYEMFIDLLKESKK